jgi:hypothetical protein
MRFKLIQLHQSRGRSPSRAKSRGGPIDSIFMIQHSGLEIPDTPGRIGNWKCVTSGSRVGYCFDELQSANNPGRMRLPYVHLARDWVISTCRGKTKAKPDGHNHIAVLSKMNNSN